MQAFIRLLHMYLCFFYSSHIKSLPMAAWMQHPIENIDYKSNVQIFSLKKEFSPSII